MNASPLRVVPTEAVRAPVARAQNLIEMDDLVCQRDDCRLRWSGPEHVVYDVRVLGPELETIAEEYELRETAYRVPAELLAAIPPGTRLWWQVDARLPGGSASATSISILELADG